ncbi:hypothetical protein [Acidiferrobacter sp.]|jgi:hypothetical protein|uniref:hypothetical protein n=1 Tax=Acidiferrobacter sp. TaxID=1872107 RepID=UPI002601A9E9|nr:hypothetical protein [Acidiferrobacter sp.]
MNKLLSFFGVLILAFLSAAFNAVTPASARVISLECTFSPSLTPNYAVDQDNGRPMSPGENMGYNVWVVTSPRSVYLQETNYYNGANQLTDTSPVGFFGENLVQISRDFIVIRLTVGSLLQINRDNGTLKYYSWGMVPNTIDMFRCVKSGLPLPAPKF